MNLEQRIARIENLSEEGINILAEIAGEKLSRGEQPFRRLDFSEGEGRSEARNINRIMATPARDLNPVEQEIQSYMDDTYIVSSMLQRDPRQTKMWQRLMSISDRTALRKAMDTATAGEGSEWVPTGMSQELIEKFRLESKVAIQFPDIAMPTNPYDLPFISGDIQFYLVPESQSDEPSKAPASTPGTGKRTLTAVKLKARVLFSDELTEDSIVPVLPSLKEEIILAGAETLDGAIINGDTTSPHLDSDVTDSKDYRKSWKGLRKFATVTTVGADMSTFNVTNFRTITTAMGKYGTTPSRMFIIAGVKSYNKFKGLTELITLDKYGPKAVIFTGEVAKLDGISIITSEKIREDLDATGVYSGSYTIFLVVYKPGFTLGSRGTGKLNVKNDIDTDQNTLVLGFRKHFIDRWAVSTSVTTVGLGYKIS